MRCDKQYAINSETIVAIINLQQKDHGHYCNFTHITQFDITFLTIFIGIPGRVS